MKTITLLITAVLLSFSFHSFAAEETMPAYDDAKYSGGKQGADHNILGSVSDCPCDKNKVGTAEAQTPFSDKTVHPVGEAAAAAADGKETKAGDSGSSR